LRGTTAVPRELVHRSAHAEVLPTGWVRRAEDRFTVTAQWPRSHRFFIPTDGQHDPTIVAETVRQVGTLLAHAEYAVPLTHRFLMHDLSYTVDPAGLVVGCRPAKLEIEVLSVDVRRRGTRLAGLRYEAHLFRDGVSIGQGAASYDCISQEVYRRLRGARADAVPDEPVSVPLAACAVGRLLPEDVVLAARGEPASWLLHADPGHPVLFDHACDHIPGMVLIEAARQAASTCYPHADFQPVSLQSRFHQYAELNTECVIRTSAAEHLPTGGLRVEAWQNSAKVFECDLLGRAA
jgi:hypothetical protein